MLRTDKASNKYPDIVWSLVFGAVGASILAGLSAFICWVSCWRNLRCTLVGLAILATLIAIFYTEEDLRGKHAWEVCQRQLEAQGVVLDWDKFLPPSVPDDQNFYTFSTNLLLRFKQVSRTDADTTNAEYKLAVANPWLKLDPLGTNYSGTHDRKSLFPTYDTSKNGPIVIAKIIVLQGNENTLTTGTNNFTVTLNDTAASNQIRDRIRDILRSGIGQFTHGVEGFDFSEFQLTSLPLVQIFVRASTPPPVETLNTFCPSDAVTGFGKLHAIATTDPNTFDIVLTDMRITSAADYLKWSDQFIPAFDEIREALKRPYAIIPGDYSIPAQMPIPNFVTMRALAQTLGQRAQCYLLLGQPDKALHEVMFIHDICRILEKPPTGKPETLVEAMINVAIHGVYTAIIAEGMQRHQWQEPQLAALQEQLKEIDLTPFVWNAFQEMPADLCRNAEIVPLQKWLTVNGGRGNRLSPIVLMPRGWVYQNMAQMAELQSKTLPVFDPSTGTISPTKMDFAMHEIEKTLKRHSPFLLLARIAIPNFSKAMQVTAYNQTQVNEAQIACALERYHLAYGQYPDTLDALVPQFMQTIPHDVIGGGPLHYRRTDDGKFLLYSIGWNETDDGGQPLPQVKHSNPTDYTKGDWIWPVTAK
ncbi:MAG TPA: hypothetical protein VMH87_05245 [Pseudomonadales bacterium]|nr:hypothetical protein [Pseudomonadales bacterium]